MEEDTHSRVRGGGWLGDGGIVRLGVGLDISLGGRGGGRPGSCRGGRLGIHVCHLGSNGLGLRDCGLLPALGDSFTWEMSELR